MIDFDSLAITLIIAAAIALFFILRSVILWYFKIDSIAQDLHTIAEHYREQEPTQPPRAGS